jgi:hypothetical protein
MFRVWCEFTDGTVSNVVVADWCEEVRGFTKPVRKLVITKLLVRDNRQLDLL